MSLEVYLEYCNIQLYKTIFVFSRIKVFLVSYIILFLLFICVRAQISRPQNGIRAFFR